MAIVLYEDSIKWKYGNMMQFRSPDGPPKAYVVPTALPLICCRFLVCSLFHSRTTQFSIILHFTCRREKLKS